MKIPLLVRGIVAALAIGGVGYQAIPSPGPVQVKYQSSPPSLTNGQQVQIQGTTDGAQKVAIDSSTTVPVSGTFFQATQPVSGTFWQTTQPISAASLPLPTGSATSALQSTLNGYLSGLSYDGSSYLNVHIQAAATTPVTGTFWQSTQPVSGTFWQSTQPVSLATAPTTPVTGSFWQTTQPVSLATAPTTPVTGTFWQATQPISGSLTNISGTISIPTGASTSALQTTINTTLTGIAGQLPSSLNNGALSSTPQSASSGGCTLGCNVTGITTAVNIDTSAGNVYTLDVYQTGTTTVYYAEIFNSLAVNVTLGTTPPIACFPIPYLPGGLVKTYAMPGYFGTALSIAVVTAPGGASTAPASTCFANWGYK